jgi:hypothetical protein
MAYVFPAIYPTAEREGNAANRDFLIAAPKA